MKQISNDRRCNIAARSRTHCCNGNSLFSFPSNIEVMSENTETKYCQQYSLERIVLSISINSKFQSASKRIMYIIVPVFKINFMPTTSHYLHILHITLHCNKRMLFRSRPSLGVQLAKQIPMTEKSLRRSSAFVKCCRKTYYEIRRI